MDELIDVVKVTAMPGYLLQLEFENGEHRLFDMSSIIDKKPFIRLKENNTLSPKIFKDKVEKAGFFIKNANTASGNKAQTDSVPP